MEWTIVHLEIRVVPALVPPADSPPTHPYYYYYHPYYYYYYYYYHPYYHRDHDDSMEPYPTLHGAPLPPGQTDVEQVNSQPTAPREDTPPLELVIEGTRKAILGYTWPGIEDGEPPFPAYSFFEYVDAVRTSTLESFLDIQERTKEWWFPTLDRGAGALIHFAVDHGRLDMVKYLIEELKVPVNHQALNGNWTPLHRCARMVHYKHAPFFDIFELLLAHGGDPELETEEGLTAMDLVVQKGFQWEPGEVRARVRALVEQYSGVEKGTPWFYTGLSIGDTANRVMCAWRSVPSLYPPEERAASKGKRGHGRLS
jgi:hypothetical protein